MAPSSQSRIARELDRGARWIRRGRGLAALRRAGGRAALVADAVEVGRRSRFSAPEREWIKRIEAVRARLEASGEIVRTVRSELSGDPSDAEVIEDRVGTVCREASHPPLWAGILMAVVRRLRPRFCVEMGTCLGISAAYQAAALELNGAGRMISLEGSRERAAIATTNLGELGLGRVEVRAGRFAETLPTALADAQAVDYAFVDGHHDEQATQRYFHQIVEVAAESAVVVFDDVRWSEGMLRAWQSIRAEPAVAASVDLGPVGICLLGDEAGPSVSVPLA